MVTFTIYDFKLAVCSSCTYKYCFVVFLKLIIERNLPHEGVKQTVDCFITSVCKL